MNTSPTFKPMVFIPRVSFQTHEEQGSEVGEYAGGAAAPIANVSGMSGLAHGIHMMEAAGPIIEAQSPRPTSQMAKVLQDMYMSNINRPAPGSFDGLLLDWDTAAALGLVPESPVEMSPASISSRIQAQRNESERASALSQNTNAATSLDQKKKKSSASWQSPNQTKPWLQRLTPSWFGRK